MNILIVEDCPETQYFLKDIIKKNYRHWSVDFANSYEIAVDLAIQNIYDLFILDYELDKNNPDKNGLSLGLFITALNKYKYTPVIFETLHSEQIVNVVNQLNCLYYLIKPYDENQVISMIKKVLNYMPSKIVLLLKDEYGLLSHIQIEDILYIKSDRHKLMVVTKYKSLICINHSLTSLSELCNGLLIRCHKSYLVNAEYISSIDKSNYLLSVEYPATQKSYIIKIGHKYIKSVLSNNNI